MERNAVGDAALTPGAGRTTPWVWHWAWNAGLGVGERRSSPRVYIAGTRNLGTAMRGNERGERRGTKGNAVRPVATSSATGPNGNCAATVSVRSAIAVRPGQGEAAVRLPLSSSYAAVMGKRPELDVRSNRRMQRVRSRFSRSAVKPKGKGRGFWVASQSLGSPPVSGTAVSSGSAVKRDSWIAVLGPVATSAILVLVVRDSVPRDGFLVKRHLALRLVRDAVPWLRIPGEAHRHFDGLGTPRRGLDTG